MNALRPIVNKNHPAYAASAPAAVPPSNPHKLPRAIAWAAPINFAPDITPAAMPVYRVEIHDGVPCLALDPMLLAIVPIWASPAVALAILGSDGSPLFTLTPVEAGTPPTGDLSLAAYELVTSQHGHDDDTGETSDHWVLEGHEAMAAALEGLESLGSGLKGWRGEPESRLRQVEAIGRWYGLTPARIAEITGRPFVARKSLLPTCGMARQLDAQRADHVVAQRQAAVATESARVEALRPRTLAELGVEGICVRRDRVATDALANPHNGDAPPWFGAFPLFVSNAEVWWGWKSVAGLELPAFDEHGARSLRGDLLVPPGMREPVELTAPAFAFLRALRQRFGVGLDFGPVASFIEPTVEVLARAKAIARRHVRAFSDVPPMTIIHVQRIAADLIVRGLLIDPIAATVVLYSEMDLEWEKRTPQQFIPATVPMSPSSAPIARGRIPLDRAPRPSGELKTGGGWVADLCVESAHGGCVSVGALLNAPATFAKKQKKH